MYCKLYFVPTHKIQKTCAKSSELFVRSLPTLEYKPKFTKLSNN